MKKRSVRVLHKTYEGVQNSRNMTKKEKKIFLVHKNDNFYPFAYNFFPYFAAS
jgi:hypothetical protein